MICNIVAALPDRIIADLVRDTAVSRCKYLNIKHNVLLSLPDFALVYLLWCVSLGIVEVHGYISHVVFYMKYTYTVSILFIGLYETLQRPFQITIICTMFMIMGGARLFVLCNVHFELALKRM